MNRKKFGTILRFLVGLALAIAVGAPAPVLADAQSDEGADPAERSAPASEATRVTAAERDELLAFVDAFEGEFARTLDVAPLRPSRFAPEAFTYDDADAFADFGAHLSGVLLRDGARRRRLTEGVANVTLLEDLACASPRDFPSRGPAPDCRWPAAAATLGARWEAERRAFDDHLAPDAAVRALDDFLSLTEALARELAASVPRDVTEGGRYLGNTRRAESQGHADVRRDDAPACAVRGAVARYVVVRGGVYYAIARTHAGLALAEVGPASE